MALAVLVCVVGGTVSWWIRRGPSRHDDDPETGVRRFLSSPQAVIVIFALWGYLVLSTTDNAGSLFELPFIPAVVLLAVYAASRSLVRLRPYLATLCLLAASVSLAGMSVSAPDVSTASRSLSIGSFSVTAFDGRGTLLGYASATGGACRPRTPCVRSGTTPGETSYLAEWLAPSQRMATLLHTTATDHGCEPVVFFGVQDPLFNTNTVDLDYQLRYSSALPTGLLKARYDLGEGPLQQLNDPNLGQPNLVILGRALATSPHFSPFVGYRATIKAVKTDGFAPATGLRLPDGRVMTVWWKDRGPCQATRP
jgi:hypothetical protein